MDNPDTEARKVWWYQWDNQNPQFGGQALQWSKEKGQKNKQQSTKLYAENNRSSNTNPTTTGGEHSYSVGYAVHVPLVKPLMLPWL